MLSIFVPTYVSGFAFSLALTEGARKATEVSAKNRRRPLPSQAARSFRFKRAATFFPTPSGAERAATT